MTDTTDFEAKRDIADIAVERYKQGRLTRRGFVAAMGALGILPALNSKAFAQAKEIVVVNWGGTAKDVLQEVLCDTYTELTGIPVVVDGSGPSAGKIRAMVESGAVVWDLCDSGAGSAIILEQQGVTQPIDYSIVDKSKVLEGTAYNNGVGNYVYSYVLATNPKLLGGNVPQNWADVWNTKDFPGMRTFRKSVRGMLESATMAQGVPLAEVYDVLGTDEGIKAGIAKFRELRENIIVWGSGSDSQNLFLQEEVAIGNIWSTRAHLLKDQMDEGSFNVSFNGGVIAPGVNLSLEALHMAAAALPHVDITHPDKVIGTNTVACMQSGIFWGYVGLIKEISSRIMEERDREMKVIGTGGLAPLFQSHAPVFDRFEDNLTMHGLKVIYEHNREQGTL